MCLMFIQDAHSYPLIIVLPSDRSEKNETLKTTVTKQYHNTYTLKQNPQRLHKISRRN